MVLGPSTTGFRPCARASSSVEVIELARTHEVAQSAELSDLARRSGWNRWRRDSWCWRPHNRNRHPDRHRRQRQKQHRACQSLPKLPMNPRTARLRGPAAPPSPPPPRPPTRNSRDFFSQPQFWWRCLFSPDATPHSKYRGSILLGFDQPVLPLTLTQREVSDRLFLKFSCDICPLCRLLYICRL